MALTQKQLSSTLMKKTPVAKITGDGSNLDQEQNWRSISIPSSADSQRPDRRKDAYNHNLPVGKPAITPRSSTSPDAPANACGT